MCCTLSRRKRRRASPLPSKTLNLSNRACVMRRSMTMRKIEAYEGSGNIFADLGLPNPEERLLKSSIVTELHRLIKARDLTQVKAAKLIGISQPDLSHLLRGDYDDYSAERLMKMLTMFEQDIEIVMRPHRKAGEPGRITFKPVAA